MREKIEQAIKHIRPVLQADGGDIELLDVNEKGEVLVRMTGACAGCPMSQMTLTEGVERTIMEMVPEVKRVINV